MKFLEYLKESEGKIVTLYHVTMTKNVPKIAKQGIRLMQTTNWTTALGKRYGEGDIYAMTNELDAFRWAGRMDWEFNKKMGSGDISVIEFKTDPSLWKIDRADPISQAGNRGKWLQSSHPIKPEQIIKSTPVKLEQIKKVTMGEENTLKEKFITADKLKQRWGYNDDLLGYCQLHKNPDADEVLTIINDYKEANPEQYKKTGEMDFVRGIFDIKNDLYVWYGNFFHEPVIDKFNLKADTSENFKFGWEKGDMFLTVEAGWLKNFFTHPQDKYNNQSVLNILLKRLKKAFPSVIGGDGLPKFTRSFLVANPKN